MINVNIDELYENMEFLAEQAHNSWWEEKKKNGFHPPRECPFYPDSCDKCHRDMIPYNELPDEIKEYDRGTVRTVLEAIREL